MTVIIKKSDSKDQIEKKLSRITLSSRKKRREPGFRAMLFLGKVKSLYGNPLAYQKRIRNEWE